MSPQETIELTRILDALSRLYPKLMGIAASEAVRFFKQRFIEQAWVGATTNPWKRRKDNKDRGRAILVKTGTLKRDIQKIYVDANTAIIGTTRITAGYAKVHNEGFRGVVTVKAHTRRRFVKVKERYTTKSGKERTRTSKQVEAQSEAIKVGTFRRKINIPKRQYMGASPVMDRNIERSITRQIIFTIKQAQRA